MQPDIIALLQGGVINGHSATYEDRDAFGTLGGRARIEAAALLAKQFPHALVLATDAVNADELKALGVEEACVVFAQPEKKTTFSALRLIAAHAKGTLAIVSNEYHLPRVRAFWEILKAPPAQFVSAESILAEADPAFAEKFDEIKQTPAYHERLQSEARGVEAIKRGQYAEAPAEDKQERAV